MAGWVHRRRDHGGLIFIDLRDRSGLVQLVFHPETARRGASPLAERPALRARGLAPPARSSRASRATSTRTSPTGEIEIARARAATLLADAETPPFPIDEDAPVDEMLRLRYRMLDLRREQHARRDGAAPHGRPRRCATYLDERDFLEIETPILTRSTPEGARDFLVPSRAAAAAPSTRCRSRRSSSSSC